MPQCFRCVVTRGLSFIFPDTVHKSVEYREVEGKGECGQTLSMAAPKGREAERVEGTKRGSKDLVEIGGGKRDRKEVNGGEGRTQIEMRNE